MVGKARGFLWHGDMLAYFHMLNIITKNTMTHLVQENSLSYACIWCVDGLMLVFMDLICHRELM